MAYLADTNVMWRRFDLDDPRQPAVKAVIDGLLASGETIYITAQNLIEFQALATRPAVANGLGITMRQANEKAREIEAFFPLLPEIPEIYAHWRTLMENYDAPGRQVYDARLVAVMLAHGVTHILTMNSTHFRRFAGIVVVEPSTE